MPNINKPLISFCMPTNGISEWVFPVLDSIYSQGINENIFQVIVSDNGKDSIFHSKMLEYSKKHSNLIYQRNNSVGFSNQINALRLGTGSLLKLINHRFVFEKNSIQYYISLVNKYLEEKPIIFFSNKNLNLKKRTMTFDSFDTFMNELSYWSSWSDGISIWKEDFNNIDFTNKPNEYFPHCKLLFSVTKNRNFIIDNTFLSKERLTSQTKKAKYNLFYAFSIEYVDLLLALYKKGTISLKTFLNLKRKVKNLLSIFYLDFIIRKKKSSYNLDNFKNYLNVFYSFRSIKRNLYKAVFLKLRTHLKMNNKKDKFILS